MYIGVSGVHFFSFFFFFWGGGGGLLRDTSLLFGVGRYLFWGENSHICLNKQISIYIYIYIHIEIPYYRA